MEHIEPKNSPGSKQQIESIHTIRIVNSSEVIPLFKRSNNSQPFTDSGPSNSLGDFGDLGHLDEKFFVFCPNLTKLQNLINFLTSK